MMVRFRPHAVSSSRHVHALLLATAALIGTTVAACAKDPPDSMEWTPPATGGQSGSTGGTGVPSDPYVPPADGLTPVERNGQLAVVGNHLVNAKGEEVQLKGPSSMWLNWENSGYAKDMKGITQIRDAWGGSIIRAAMGVEPTGAYLTDPARAKADVTAVIDNAIALGLYVIIDWHDHKAHLHLDQAVAFFTEMATKYGGVPNVLYETFNEPEKLVWATEVKPYHEAVVAAIRAVDPDNIIILGTPTWSQDVGIAAGDPVVGTNLMYTLHFYSCTHTAPIRSRADAAFVAGAAIFVTEWGATNADGGTEKNPQLCLEEAATWHAWMNARKISWTAWKFDDCADKTCFFQPNVPTTGPWTDAMLNGHGAFVRQHMQF